MNILWWKDNLPFFSVDLRISKYIGDNTVPFQKHMSQECAFFQEENAGRHKEAVGQ